MKIVLDKQNKDPIYTQIYEQIRNQIATGLLLPDFQLPSIRSFALDLKVSVITVKRAYEDLERDGFIYSIPAKGSYVKNMKSHILKEKYVEEILEQLLQVAKKAQLVGIDEEQILNYYRKAQEKL